MKYLLIAVFAALLSSLSAYADGDEGRVIHCEGSSRVFDATGALTIAANDDAVSRFTYDECHCVTRAETLVGETMFDVAWRRDAGVQNAVYQAIVEEWGSPLQRLGAYGNAGERPAVVDGEIVDALWDLGAASTAYKNLGGNTPKVSPASQGRSTTDFIGNAKVISFGKVVGSGTIDVGDAIRQIEQGYIPVRNTFRNWDNSLPKASSIEYYHEYVVPTPGINGVGSQRIIRGQGGEYYYTPDHYKTFIPLN